MSNSQIRLRQVSDAIEGLPPAEREALLLFAWEDLGYEQIAEAQNVPVGTVRSRLARARGDLRTILGGRR